MDIHRCRFVPYPPSAINAVAFSHSTQTKSQKSTSPLRLAIGRANGDIEIWDPLGGIWHHETTLHGGKDRSIDGLVWVNEPDQVLSDGTRMAGRLRLFSIGYTSTVTEWDLEKGRPRKQASGMHGDIWCLGAQPLPGPGKGQDGTSKSDSTKLVAGTMDGNLVLYSIDGDDLRFDRILSRSHNKKTKMVSIAFQNRNTFVVGCSDSAVRVYDIRSGQLIRKMTLGSDLAGGAKEIIVWSVKCIGNRDIISGDSTGQVCIWDGKTYTQAQRLQSHKQDVLSLATSADGSTIISGGMDRKTVLYRKTRGSGERWGRVWHRRYHNHDVKTMSSFEGHGMSVVVSGGPDASPIVMPLQEAGMEHHRTLSNLPQSPPVRSAAKSRLIVSWWDREVHIWRLRKSLRDLAGGTDPESGVTKNNNRKLLARVLIKGEANITSAAISDDGSLLFVATTSDIKAFHLQPRSPAKQDELKISKLDIPEEVSAQGANQIEISPDGSWLSIVQNGNVPSVLRVIHDADGESKPAIHPKAIRLHRIHREMPKHVTMGGLKLYDRMITHITFSPDSRLLAMSDLAGFIDTWVLSDSAKKLNGVDEDMSSDESSDEEDDEVETTGSLRWIKNPQGKLIPQLRSAATVLSFSNHTPASSRTQIHGDSKDDSDDYQLLAITAKPQVLVLNPTYGSLTSWSRRNPITRFPLEFRNIRDTVKGALWAGNRVWLYGNSFLFMLDLSQDVASQEISDRSSALVPANGALVKQGQKRKRGRDTGAGSKIEVGAMGPARVLRHVEGEITEELPLTGQAADAMDTDATSGAGDDSDDESDVEEQGELAYLRDGESKPALEGTLRRGLPFWHTFKYRPILGIVAMGGHAGQGGADGESTEPLEVALIERPMWEIEMADRYMADGE